MTTEEKYNKALELARTYYNGGNEFLDTIFPELKESEDERIRKILIHIVKGACNKYGIKYKGDEITEEKLLAYLEKQKEQKPTQKFRVGDMLISTKNSKLTYKILEVGHINELGNPEYKVEIFEDGKPGIMDKPHNIHYMECHKVDEWGKLIEQKPAEWSDDYDEDNLQARFAFYTYKDDQSTLYLSNVFVEETSRNKGFGTKILAAAERVAETLGITSIRLKVKRDSPANAWYRKHGYSYMTFKGDYDWLEKKYMKPNMQEWSEEDKEMLDAMIDIVSNSLYEPLCPREGMLAWLKSLRPQPHWKPSEEQMEALKYTLGNGGTYNKEALLALFNDLQEQLKKLI